MKDKVEMTLTSSNTIKISVRYFALLRELVGKREEELSLPEGSSVLDALRVLTREHGEEVRNYIFSGEGLSEGVTVLLNGEAIDEEELEQARLASGDELAILPPIGGGAHGQGLSRSARM